MDRLARYLHGGSGLRSGGGRRFGREGLRSLAEQGSPREPVENARASSLQREGQALSHFRGPRTRQARQEDRVAEFMGAIAAFVERLVESSQRPGVGEGAQQLVVARS